jgi:hypothetical protein
MQFFLCQQSKRFRLWVHRLNISHYNYLNTVTRTHTKRGLQFVYNIQPAESFPKFKFKLNPPLTHVYNVQPAQSLPTKRPLWVFWLERIEQAVSGSHCRRRSQAHSQTFCLFLLTVSHCDWLSVTGAHSLCVAGPDRLTQALTPCAPPCSSRAP